MPHIVHLIDDQTPGGVTRYLEFLTQDQGMTALADHSLVPVSRYRAAKSGLKADAIVSHLTLTWRGLPGLTGLRALYPTTPLVHVEHSYCERFVAANVANRLRFKTLLRSGYALFDRVVAVSATQADWMQRAAQLSHTQLAVIPPCVSLSRMAALPSPGRALRRVGAIGRLDRQKGFDLLIPAFRDLPFGDVALDIYGDGPERAALEDLAGLDRRITFRGHTDPVVAMAASDAVAMPSRWEPFGLVATEALVSGRPLLVSGADGLADHVVDGAERVPEFTVPRWSRALSALFTRTVTAPRMDADTASHRTRTGWAELLGQVAHSA